MGYYSFMLASDLDLTLLPPPEQKLFPSVVEEFSSIIKKEKFLFLCSTGRNPASALRAIEESGLLFPDYLACDAGSRIFKITGEEKKLDEIAEYKEWILRKLPDWNPSLLEQWMEEFSALSEYSSSYLLVRQEEEHQSFFKRSYYVLKNSRGRYEDPTDAFKNFVSGKISRDNEGWWQGIFTFNPALDRAYFDLLPGGVDKLSAALFVARLEGIKHERIIVAGDSGNDLAALAGGLMAIIPSNVTPCFRNQLLERSSRPEKLYFAEEVFLKGVIEGLKYWVQSCENK